MNNSESKGPGQLTGSGFFERTVRNVRRAWRGITESAYDASWASMQPDLPEADAKRLRAQMRACLTTPGGEVSARARTAAVGEAYLALAPGGRENFLKIMARDFDVDHAAVRDAADVLRRTSGPAAVREAERALAKTLEAPRIRLLKQFNALPEGVKFLVDMRAELLALKGDDPALDALEEDLKSLLATWFDVDFLELRRITWDTAPGALLEKLIAYEAVHAMESWDDLKSRLDSDRRFFAYFHPCMPDEPLIFVEVALVNGMAKNVQDLLDPDAPALDPMAVDSAIFYSISNTQRGLAGISFGNFLIKRVVDTLSHGFEQLKTFATLSPVPGFRRWLTQVAAAEGADLLFRAERRKLEGLEGFAEAPQKALVNLFDDPGWHEDAATRDAVRGPLMRLCARYLLAAKRGDDRALDPVAHFHLSNGARVESLNWMADTSPRGLAQSAGMMINYLYRLNKIEANYEAYSARGEIIASSAFKSLEKG